MTFVEFNFGAGTEADDVAAAADVFPVALLPEPEAGIFVALPV